jgi:hypothetical protein
MHYPSAAQRSLSASVGVAVVLGVTLPLTAQFAARNHWQAVIVREQDFGCELEAKRQSLLEHNALSYAMVDELITGRITLRCAAARRLVFDAQWSRVLAELRQDFPGRTDLECEARWLVFHACARSMHPLRLTLLVARLVTELEALTVQHRGHG